MKILIGLIICLSMASNVSAKTYYSDYNKYSDYSNSLITSSDIREVETKRLYNKYFDVAEGGYYLYGDNPVYYPYVNINIYKDTTFSDWNIEYPIDNYGRIIESRSIFDDINSNTKYLEFRYKDRMYYYYNENPKKISSNSSLRGYIKDENDYVLYYRYRQRDKIEVLDNIIITDSTDIIDNYINSTTNYKIEGNLDYTKNGIYNINIITGFVTIPTSVKILIEDNFNNYYNKLLFTKENYIESLKNQIFNNYQDINKAYIENEDLKSTVSNLNNDLSIKELELKEYSENLEISTEKVNYLEGKLEDSINNSENIKKLNLNKESNIISLNNNIINELKDKNTLIMQQSMDNLKRLNLCKTENESINKKLLENKKMNLKNTIFTLFIEIVFFLILIAILKIKSIKN